MSEAKQNLERYSTEELVKELRRRRVVTKPEKRIYCEDCANFIAWKGPINQDPPDDYNPCRMGHVMNFHVGEFSYDPNADDTGFYRRGCADRELTPVPKEAPRPKQSRTLKIVDPATP